MERDKIIVKTSIIGIVANVLLAGFKAVVGLLSHSIAITLDAVNNLSDALSSVITIIGTFLAGKPADKKHPYGYGRIEYFSAILISVIVLYAGVTSLVESVKKIISPEQADYGAAALIIVTAAVIVKIVLGIYVKKTGEKVHSDSLIASGQDAVLDSVISLSTLVAAGIYLIFHVSLEAYLGAIISVVIIKSGFDMLRDTISEVLGERVDSVLSKNIKQAICETDGVLGAYDLVLNDYGPDRLMGSVHIEVYDTTTADEIDRMTRDIQQRIYTEFNVILAGIGVYSVNTKNDRAAEVRTEVSHIVSGHPEILQMHGFYLNETAKSITFDIVVDFAADDRATVYRTIVDEVQGAFPDYSLRVAMDSDVSD